MINDDNVFNCHGDKFENRLGNDAGNCDHKTENQASKYVKDSERAGPNPNQLNYPKQNNVSEADVNRSCC